MLDDVSLGFFLEMDEKTKFRITDEFFDAHTIESIICKFGII